MVAAFSTTLSKNVRTVLGVHVNAQAVLQLPDSVALQYLTSLTTLQTIFWDKVRGNGVVFFFLAVVYGLCPSISG